jgi:hypothetical protein
MKDAQGKFGRKKTETEEKREILFVPSKKKENNK